MDDTQLVILARKPPGELFPILRRAAAFRPLLMPLCILPPLYAFLRMGYGELDALWGLRAMELSSAPWSEWKETDVEASGIGSVLRAQPPLGIWLTSLFVRFTQATSISWLLLVSLISTAATLVVFVGLMRAVSSSRVALWSALLAAFHPGLLPMAARFDSASLGVLAALLAMWGFCGHLEYGRRERRRLIAGGVGLGLSLFSGGSLALGVAIILLLTVLGMRGESLSRRQWSDPRTVNVWTGWPAMKSLIYLVLVSLAIGGWWPVVQTRKAGLDGFSEWLLSSLRTGDSLEIPGLQASASVAGLETGVGMWLLFMAGPLMGLLVLSVFRAMWAVLISNDEPRRRSQLFLLTWALVSLCVSAGLNGERVMGPVPGEQWQAMLALGICGLVAFLLDDVAQRQISVRAVALSALIGGVILLTIGWKLQLRAVEREGALLVAALGATFLATLLWSWLDSTFEKDAKQRAMLMTMMLIHVFGHAAYGLRSLPSATADDSALEAFREGVQEHGPFAEAVIIGDPRDVSLRLRLITETLTPGANVEFVTSWESVLARMINRKPNEASAGMLVVDWSGRDLRPANLQAAGIHLQPVTGLQFFGGGPLRAYFARADGEMNIDPGGPLAADQF